MRFIEYLRFCFALGVALIIFLGFAFIVSWLILVLPLPEPVAFALGGAVMLFVTPALCWAVLRIMHRIID